MSGAVTELTSTAREGSPGGTSHRGTNTTKEKKMSDNQPNAVAATCDTRTMTIDELLAHASEVRKQTVAEVAAAENRAREAVKAVRQALAEGGTEYTWEGPRPAPRKRVPRYRATHQPLGFLDTRGAAQDMGLRVCHDMGYTTTRTATGTRQAPRGSVTGVVDGVRYQNGVCTELVTWEVCKPDGRTFHVCDAHLADEYNPHLRAARSESAIA